MAEVRILSTEEIRELVPMSVAVGLMREAFAWISSGESVVPQRLSMEMERDKSRSLMMPAYSAVLQRYAAKVVTLSDDNPKRNLPFIHGLLLLFDSATGVPLALMNAEYITVLRTGAASGVATDLLARADAGVAMIFGAGAQARSQLAGIASVRRLDRVLVYSPLTAQTERFCNEMQSKYTFDILAAESPHKVSDADIVCAATTAEQPVFEDADLKSGVHINGIGSYKPSTREIPSETIKRSKIVVDSRSAALAEAGDLVIPMKDGLINNSHIYAELGEILLGQKPPRMDSTEITVFKSVGNAVQDLAVAAYAARIADHDGVGKIVDI